MISLLQEDQEFTQALAEACVSSTSVASDICSILHLALSDECMQPAAIADGLSLLHEVGCACCKHASVSGLQSHAFLSAILSSLADVSSLAEALHAAEPNTAATAATSEVHSAFTSWMLLTWQVLEIVAHWPDDSQRGILSDPATALAILEAAIVGLQRLTFPEATAVLLR